MSTLIEAELKVKVLKWTEKLCRALEQDYKNYALRTCMDNQEKGIIEFIGDLKYQWQYALRWNKTELKKRGIIKKHTKGKHTYWILT